MTSITFFNILKCTSKVGRVGPAELDHAETVSGTIWPFT